MRLNDDTWLYEITTEDPVILTGPFTVRYPMRNDASYFTPEYACHEDNTIVRNYTNTSRHERANPTPEPPQPPVQVGPGVADALAGRWVGRPRIATIDVDIELEFTKNADGTVNGKLIGTNLGPHRSNAARLHDRGSDRVLHAAERRSVAVLRRYGRRHDHGRGRERAGRCARDVPQADRPQPLSQSPVALAPGHSGVCQNVRRPWLAGLSTLRSPRR